MIGQTISHYRITAALGAGGMGEVYRATDTKLGREVAIKILPAEMADDAGRLERFQREAHLLAALNHPHIAAIHGLEEADGQPFLVLELVEGEDLRERLARGAIPVDEALEIAVQVAEALEEAHNAGIVHRDLKPANVKVTPDGKVKVLDFGLAKAWAGDAADRVSSSASMSESPTLAHSGTQAGVILGTAAYMSPEQARGKPVDKRTDVWAFGVLFWEMLTGRTLFSGDTVTDVIAAVVTKEPDLEALPSATPPAVRRLMSRCFRKDPRKRLPDIGAARLELEDALAGDAEETGGTEAGRDAAVEIRRLERQRWGWAAISLVLAGTAAALAVLHWSGVPDPRPPVRFTVDAPEGWSFEGWPVPSPDGRHVATWGDRDDTEEALSSRMLWLRSLGSLALRPLAGTEGQLTGDPFWSPNSRFIGFFADGELHRLNLDDGTVRKVCALPALLGLDAAWLDADWNEDGTIIFGATKDFSTEPGGLYTVPSTGGEPKPLLMADPTRGEQFFAQPQFLPDGRRFLFTAVQNSGARLTSLGVQIGSVDQPDERRLLVPEIGHLELTGGHVLFNREDTLLAQPFDVERAELGGEPVAIASSVAVGAGDRGSFGVSPGGTLAYLSGEEEDRFQLAWLDRKGAEVGTVGAPRGYDQIALSPDGKRVSATIRDSEGQLDLWVLDVSRGVLSRLTSDPAHELAPVWSPDGQELAFSKETRDGTDLFRTELHRGASAVAQLELPGFEYAEDWSRDGETLLYMKVDVLARASSLWALPLAGDGAPELLAQQTGFQFFEPRLSPDGRWLAYISNESGAFEVYVEPFRRAGERQRVSLDGGGQPKWRGDGKELFYRKLDGPLMTVEVRDTAGKLEVGLPTELFDAGEFRNPHADVYAVSEDGQRFLVMLPVEGSSKPQMHIVVNWESMLESEE